MSLDDRNDIDTKFTKNQPIAMLVGGDAEDALVGVFQVQKEFSISELFPRLSNDVIWPSDLAKWLIDNGYLACVPVKEVLFPDDGWDITVTFVEDVDMTSPTIGRKELA
jgi:hypothetical protein